MSRNIAAGCSAGIEPVLEQVLQVHQAGDGQPALDARRAGTAQRRAAGLVEADEEVESRADPEVEQEERRLDAAAHELRPVAAPPGERLARPSGAGRRRRGRPRTAGRVR